MLLSSPPPGIWLFASDGPVRPLLAFNRVSNCPCTEFLTELVQLTTFNMSENAPASVPSTPPLFAAVSGWSSVLFTTSFNAALAPPCAFAP